MGTHCKIPVKTLVSLPGQSLAQLFRTMLPGNKKGWFLYSNIFKLSFSTKIYFRVAVEIPLALNSTSPKTASTKFTNTRYKHVNSTYLQKLQQLELI